VFTRYFPISALSASAIALSTDSFIVFLYSSVVVSIEIFKIFASAFITLAAS